MNTKKLLLRSLFVGGTLALTRLLFAKPASVKQVSMSSYDAIDAYIEEQMRRLHIPGVSLAIIEATGLCTGAVSAAPARAVKRPPPRRPSSSVRSPSPSPPGR